MKKILYIYGMDGHPDNWGIKKLRRWLRSTKYELINPSYPQDDAAESKAFLEDIARREQVDVIFGESLGGFLAMTLDVDVPKVMLNPCVYPGELFTSLRAIESGDTQAVNAALGNLRTDPFRALLNNRNPLVRFLGAQSGFAAGALNLFLPLISKNIKKAKFLIPSQEQTDSYAALEPQVFSHLPEGSRCFMGDRDGVLGDQYHELVSQHIPIESVDSGHTMSRTAAILIARYIRQLCDSH